MSLRASTPVLPAIWSHNAANAQSDSSSIEFGFVSCPFRVNLHVCVCVFFSNPAPAIFPLTEFHYVILVTHDIRFGVYGCRCGWVIAAGLLAS